MILTIFQNGPPVEMALYTTMAIFFAIGLVMLKIGLVISKAEVRTGIKWMLASFGIQVGIFFFVAGPLILLGISGAFGERGPEVIFIIIFLILALFIDVHVLNVIHELGIKRALLVFGLMSVPFLVVSFSVIALIVENVR